MNVEELQYIGQALTEILNSDKAIRESGEEKLKNIKSQEPDKYACYLVGVLEHRKSLLIFILNILSRFPIREQQSKNIEEMLAEI